MKNFILTLTLLLSVSISYAQSQDNSPRAVLGELKHEGPYLRSEILLQDQITVSSDDGNEYKVAKYNVIISPKGGKSVVYKGVGNILTPKIQGALNQIVAGDKVILESIYASINGDGHDMVQLEPIVLVVKKFEGEGPYNSVNGTNVPVKIDSLAIATYGSLNPGLGATLEEILKQDEIGVDAKQDVDYEVTRFKMIVAYKDSPPTMSSSSSSTITKKMKELLAKAKPGDRILIEGIRSEADVNGKILKANLSPVIITVL